VKLSFEPLTSVYVIKMFMIDNMKIEEMVRGIGEA